LLLDPAVEDSRDGMPLFARRVQVSPLIPSITEDIGMSAPLTRHLAPASPWMRPTMPRPDQLPSPPQN
jgi:hypothetical protein